MNRIYSTSRSYRSYQGVFEKHKADGLLVELKKETSSNYAFFRTLATNYNILTEIKFPEKRDFSSLLERN